MKRVTTAIGGLTLALALTSPLQAAPVERSVKWVCTVEGEPITFVAAPAAAEHGIRQADARAGTIAFEGIFGESCEVVVDP
jgi:hypothetical protein